MLAMLMPKRARI